MKAKYRVITKKINQIKGSCTLIYPSLLLLVFSLLILCQTSCNKLIEIDAPVTSVNEANVYSVDATAVSVLTGIYSKMSREGLGFTGNSGISLLAGLSSDELTLYSAVSDNKLIAYYKNALIANASQNYGSEFWGILYTYIFTCNAAIEGLNTSTTLTSSIKQQLLGEAKFMRAFFYFYLINLFGDVPLAMTTDPTKNAILARTPQTMVYQQIISDLKDAQNYLSENYLNGSLERYTGSVERLRPTKWSATALLARIYLYTGDHASAETQATIVINHSSLFSLTALNNAFLKNSNEAIWQIQPVSPNRNTEDAFAFIVPASGPSGSTNPVYANSQLLNSFEPGDHRRFNRNWIDSVKVLGATYYFPYKYKAKTTTGAATEYLMILRIGEQYLIRSEARAQQNNISGAQSDLNAIRIRAGLPNTTGNDKASLLNAILHERQVELFTEYGQRWFDLKRTNTIGSVMPNVTTLKGGTWETTDQLYPILFLDIQRNSKLIQNQGY